MQDAKTLIEAAHSTLQTIQYLRKEAAKITAESEAPAWFVEVFGTKETRIGHIQAEIEARITSLQGIKDELTGPLGMTQADVRCVWQQMQKVK